jgi:hypothetical protein
VIPFVRRGDGVHLGFSTGERAVLDGLVEQLRQIVDGDVDADPVSRRMFPDAYPGDDEASAEFRRYTREDLRSAKSANALAVHEWLTGASDGPLGAEGEQAWLRCLTDLRLTIAQRLGIDTVDPADDGDPRDGDDDGPPGLRDVYDWLGYVQEHLVMAVTGHA